MTTNFNPKVTIMIPTFNQTVFIREAIDSALAQTYTILEVVVGDDASTDSTAKIVGQTNDSRLKYIRNPVKHGRTAVWQGTYLSSLRMATGHPPYCSQPARLGWFERVRLSLKFTATNHLEFITLTARKS